MMRFGNFACSLLLLSLVSVGFCKTGDLHVVSLAFDGSSANADCYDPSMSADGRFVVFWSAATNLVPIDQNGTLDVFLRDRLNNSTELVSISSSGEQGNSGSRQPIIGRDGRFIAFLSSASNFGVSPNLVNQAFVRDRLRNSTYPASLNAAGQSPNANISSLSISSDGTFICFSTTATNMIPADSNGKGDVFVKNLVTGDLELISVAITGGVGNGDSMQPAMTPDGRYVTFASWATNLVGDDTNGVYDIFVRDRLMGTTTRITKTQQNVQANANSVRPAISDSGRFIAFECYASNLTASKTDQYADILAWDRNDGLFSVASVSNADEKGIGGSQGPTVSADGSVIAFGSDAANLALEPPYKALNALVRYSHTHVTEKVSRNLVDVDDGIQPGMVLVSGNGNCVAFMHKDPLVDSDHNFTVDIYVRELGTDTLSPVSGCVQFGSLAGQMPSNVVLELRFRDFEVPFNVVPVTIDEIGNFSTTLPSLDIDISVKASNWLRRTIRDVDLTDSLADTLELNLVNGDCNLDDVVDIFDVSAVFLNFGKLQDYGDLDKSGQVDLRDLAITFLNFEQVGDR